MLLQVTANPAPPARRGPLLMPGARDRLPAAVGRRGSCPHGPAPRDEKARRTAKMPPYSPVRGVSSATEGGCGRGHRRRRKIRQPPPGYPDPFRTGGPAPGGAHRALRVGGPVPGAEDANAEGYLRLGGHRTGHDSARPELAPARRRHPAAGVPGRPPCDLPRGRRRSRRRTGRRRRPVVVALGGGAQGGQRLDAGRVQRGAGVGGGQHGGSPSGPAAASAAAGPGTPARAAASAAFWASSTTSRSR